MGTLFARSAADEGDADVGGGGGAVGLGLDPGIEALLSAVER